MVQGPFQDGINVVGLMLCRDEDWILGASLRAALRWCDQVAITFDRCSDRSMKIAGAVSKELGGDRVMFCLAPNQEGRWDEMDMRDDNLNTARAMGGTHFAIIDADEIPTANVIPYLRTWMRHLGRGQILDLPMVPVWGPGVYRDDDSVWTRARLTVGFKDAPGLCWRAAADGYHHHARPPRGTVENRMWPIEKGQGGVMHLQFANKRRLLAKHVLYRMVDRLRWPARETAEQLNVKYDQALSEPGKLSPIPLDWMDSAQAVGISLDGTPWQEAEINRLLLSFGREPFAGLDLKGF